MWQQRLHQLVLPAFRKPVSLQWLWFWIRSDYLPKTLQSSLPLIGYCKLFFVLCMKFSKISTSYSVIDSEPPSMSCVTLLEHSWSKFCLRMIWLNNWIAYAIFYGFIYHKLTFNIILQENAEPHELLELKSSHPDKE